MTTPQAQFVTLRREAGPVLDALLTVAAIEQHAGRPDGVASVVARYAADLDRMRVMAVCAGMTGLEMLSACLLRCLETMQAARREPDVRQRRLLAQWPELVLDYLATPSNPATIDALLCHMADDAWHGMVIAGELARAVRHLATDALPAATQVPTEADSLDFTGVLMPAAAACETAMPTRELAELLQLLDDAMASSARLQHRLERSKQQLRVLAGHSGNYSAKV